MNYRQNNLLAKLFKIFERRKVSTHLDTRYVPWGENIFSFSGAAHLSRYRYLISEIFEKNDDAKNWVVLDFGCGSGYGTAMLANYCERVYGVDISDKAIEYARREYRKPNINFLVGDVTKKKILETLPEKFDLIVSFDVVEHLKEPYWYFENIYHLLKSGGTCVIGTPNRLMTLKYNRTWNPYHLREFSPKELKMALKEFFDDVQLIGQDIKDPKLRITVQEKQTKNYTILSGVILHIKRLLRILLRSLGVGIPKTLFDIYLTVDDIVFRDYEIDECFGFLAIAKKG